MGGAKKCCSDSLFYKGTWKRQMCLDLQEADQDCRVTILVLQGKAVRHKHLLKVICYFLLKRSAFIPISFQGSILA